MNIPGQIAAVFSMWIDSVVHTISARVERARATRQIAITEDEDGMLTFRLASRAKPRDVELPPCRVRLIEGGIAEPLSSEWAAVMQGAHVELALQPARFVFRPLALPGRALEFLDGIIRAQIDRLTPWTAAEVAFHWTAPKSGADDQIALTVVATARSALTAIAETFIELGASGIELTTAAAPGAERIVVHTRRVGGTLASASLRRALVAILATTGVLAMLSAGFGGFIRDSYDAQQQQIQRRIAERRAIARGSQGAAGGTPLELLVRRKQTSPSAVIAIDELSALLPDHTYATEMRIEGVKLQVSGLSRDAPSLIRILEQSPHFTKAEFFAPTTRNSNESGERFHIEARIKPQFGSGS
jgi:general secretion pathway protein L